MKLAVVTQTGIGNILADKCEDIVVGRVEQEDALNISDNILVPIKGEALNYSIGAQAIALNPEMREQVYEKLSLTKEKTISRISALFNGQRFSPWVEVSYSPRFMDGEVGPDIGFACGVSCLVDFPLEDALPQFHGVVDFIAGLNYRGQVTLDIGEGCVITGFMLGFSPAIFAMMCEASKLGVRDMLEFASGSVAHCEYYESLIVSNLISRSPFPALIPQERIRAPASAERHLWRMRTGPVEPVLVTVHGDYYGTCHKRMTGTIINLLQFDSYLQYRSDPGKSRQMVLTADKWLDYNIRRRPAQPQQVSGGAPSSPPDASVPASAS